MTYRIVLAFSFLLLASSAFADEAPAPGQTSIDASGNMEFVVKGQTALRLSAQEALCTPSSEGSIRFNKTTKVFEGCDGKGTWKNLSGDGSGASACRYGGSYAAWNPGVAGKSGCLSNNTLTGGCSCLTGYTAKTTGYGFSYTSWDTAFFLCEACP